MANENPGATPRVEDGVGKGDPKKSERRDEKRFGGQCSDEYPLWRQARPYLPEIHHALAKRVRELLTARPHPVRALDIGCGDGAITQILLENGELAAVAIDSEPKMIAQAKARLSQWVENGSLEIFEEDALHYLAGQPADSFDIVATGYVFHNMTLQYRKEVFQGLYRALKKGGIFMNADKYAQEGEAHRKALVWQLEKLFEVFGGAEKLDLLKEWVIHYMVDELSDRVMREANEVEFLDRLGFNNIEIVCRRHMDAVLFAQKI